jgi:hypothetical protein
MAVIESKDGSMHTSEFEHDGMPVFGYMALASELSRDSEERLTERKTAAELAGELAVKELVAISTTDS